MLTLGIPLTRPKVLGTSTHRQPPLTPPHPSSSLAPPKIHGSFQSPSRSADQGTLAELTHNARNATHTPAQHSAAKHSTRTLLRLVQLGRFLPIFCWTLFFLPHTLFSHSLASRIVGRSVHSTPNSITYYSTTKHLPTPSRPHRSPVERFRRSLRCNHIHLPPRALLGLKLSPGQVPFSTPR